MREDPGRTRWLLTGVYGYPIAQAARVALRTVVAEIQDADLEDVRFVLFAEGDLRVYATALDEIVPEGARAPGE